MKTILTTLTICWLSAATAQVADDTIARQLRQTAADAARKHVLPDNLTAWKTMRDDLSRQILLHSGATFHHSLPVDVRETKRRQMEGFTIRSIYFQTRPGVYATATLYVPDGKGPFPAVVVMHGHWRGGRNGEIFQSVSQRLAKNGYVSVAIDAWGSGERSSVHGEHEYHGANLGAACFHHGTSLMGLQITDNIRAVDMLCSLPFVDAAHIGATGASGGGNQAMWLAALDTRVKAVVPAVSVGTFESYIINGNCICELLPGGLTFTEEAGVLAMTAPRAMKILNVNQETNAAFLPSEMLRSFHPAAAIFDLYGKKNHMQYQLFDRTHGYWPDMQAAMIGWFNLHLKGKGDGTAMDTLAVSILPAEELQTFPTGRRDPLVATTVSWTGALYDSLVNTKNPGDFQRFLTSELTPANASTFIKAVSLETSGGRQSILLQTSPGEHFRIWYTPPAKKNGRYIIAPQVPGYELPSGAGIITWEPYGYGTRSAPTADSIHRNLPRFHTLNRSLLWMGTSLMEKWVHEMAIIRQWMKTAGMQHPVSIKASRELALAAIFHSALHPGIDTLFLSEFPLSYRLPHHRQIDFFHMGMLLPNVVANGDVALAVAAGKAALDIEKPVNMAGEPVTEEEWRKWETAIRQYQPHMSIHRR